MATSSMHIITSRPFVNKRNNQITLSLKKSQLPKELSDKIFNVKKINMNLLGWD